MYTNCVPVCASHNSIRMYGVHTSTNKKEPYGFAHRAQIEDLENLKEFYDS